MTVIVYSRPGCYACRATTRQMARLAIPHITLNIEEDEHAHMTVASSGRKELPMVDVRDGDELVDRWHGLRPERIRKLVK